MSLVTMIMSAARQLNVEVSDAAIGDPNSTATLLVRLATEEGVSLMRRYPWQVLTTEKTFTTVAADEQTNALPTDYDRMLPETMFNRGTRRRVAGPLSAEEWQQTKATLVTYVNPTFRIRGDAILMSPNPPAGQTIAYEYISKNFCKSAGGVTQADWVADSDIARLDEGLMTLGLVWRFRQVKGLSYAEDLNLYERRVADAEMRDGVKPRLSSSMGSYDRVATKLQVPDTWNIN
jgi:hypothetical protein